MYFRFLAKFILVVLISSPAVSAPSFVQLPLSADEKTLLQYADHSLKAAATITFTFDPQTKSIMLITGMEGERKSKKEDPSGTMNVWDLSGGKLESGEQPVPAALRELQEEYGITQNIAKILPTLMLEINDKKCVAFLFAFIDYQLLTQKETMEELRKNILTAYKIEKNVEIVRLGLIDIDEFFKQVQGAGNMPTAKLKVKFPVLFNQHVDYNARSDHWRANLKVMYSNDELERRIYSIINKYLQTISFNNKQGALIPG